MAKRNVTYKCPFCDLRFNRQDLVIHVGDEHEDELPEGFTPLRYVFNYVNKRPVSYHGKCTECGRQTPWDENKGRYDRQCGRKACHDSYVKKFEQNMMRTKGTTRISLTAEGQKKMLANRKISGKYKFQDGEEKTYTGSYELHALEFMDKVMEIKSSDIFCPGPILEYKFEGKTHLYITDFYYQPYNLVIEVKDGGTNPNKRSMPEYRAKQIAKEKFIIENTTFNYLRLTDNNFQQLLSVFMDLKMQLADDTKERVIHVNEAMNGLLCGFLPGMYEKDSAYIVNYMQNNVFGGPLIADDLTLKTMYGVNENGIFDRIDSSILDGKQIHIYKINNLTLHEAENKIAKFIGEEVTPNDIYEALTGNKLYTCDQMEFDPNLIECFSFKQVMDTYANLYENYIHNTDVSGFFPVLKEDSSFADAECYYDFINNKYLLQSSNFPEYKIITDHYMDESSVEYNVLKEIMFKRGDELIGQI